MPESRKTRTRYLIDKQFQLKYILDYTKILLGGAVVTIAILFSTSADRNTVYQLNNNTVTYYQKTTTSVNGKTTEKFTPIEILLPDYTKETSLLQLKLNGILIVSFWYLVIISLFTLFKSHKMAGPVLKIRQAITNFLKTGATDKVTLRKNDEFRELAELVNRLLKKK